jgi:hypothetical protein
MAQVPSTASAMKVAIVFYGRRAVSASWEVTATALTESVWPSRVRWKGRRKN